MSIERRLAAIETVLRQLLKFRADPATNLDVRWTNGVPNLVPSRIERRPAKVTGWNSGLVSGDPGYYCWIEQTFDSSGTRVDYSGGIAGGSGTFSGSDILLEVNGAIVPSGSFPLLTWVEYRAHSPNYLGRIWEFTNPLGSGGGGGSSGIAVAGFNSGDFTSGISLIQLMNRDGYIVSGNGSGVVTVGGDFLDIAGSSGVVYATGGAITSGIISGQFWSGVHRIVFNEYGPDGNFIISGYDAGDGAPGNQQTIGIDFVTRGFTGNKKVITSGYCQSGSLYLTAETWYFTHGLFQSGG